MKLFIYLHEITETINEVKIEDIVKKMYQLK